MSFINSGQLTSTEVILLNATVMAGLEQAVTTITDVKAPKIALMRDPVEAGTAGGNALNKKIPTEIVFPFAPATARAEDLSTQDRPFHPLVRNTIRMPIRNYGVGYWVSRKDFFNDIKGTLASVPKLLARAAMKIPDIQLAALLRNGKTVLDYTGSNAFATAKPISVNGAVGGTFSNLYTGRALTAINLGYVISQMMGRVGEDGMNLGIMPDTLVVPPSLYQAAVIATSMKSIVFSHVTGTGNPAPGQATGTAAQGDNWVALSGIIKKIVVLPELEEGNASIDKTTWYVMETENPDRGGAVGLLCAAEPGFEFLTNLGPSDPDVFYKNRFSWALERYVGIAFGFTPVLSRVEE